MAFLTSFRSWVQRQKDLRALDALGSEGRRDIAQDLSLSESTLCGLASRGTGASEELPKMLRAVSIDPAELSLTHPAVLRDMAVVCSECDEKSRCRSDLTLRIAAATFDEYCPNAETIEALQEEEMKI
jgi:hypothetical protein